jgi:hypothetical protein
MQPAVERALSRLPAPVRDLVINGCFVVAVGGRLRGWTSAPLATAGLYPIVVSGSELESVAHVVVHEAAHRWHAPPSVPGATALTATERVAFLSYAQREGWPIDEAEAHAADDERLAELCALAWRGKGSLEKRATEEERTTDCRPVRGEKGGATSEPNPGD